MRNLLLVDDEPEVIEGLQLILEPIKEVDIHTAYFASEALRLMDDIAIELVIADIRMPGMNGIEMWDEIHRRNPQCRVIFLSGVRDFDNIYRIIQSPNARFITKMEPEEKILKVVEEVLAELAQQDKQNKEAQLRNIYACLTGNMEDCEEAVSQLTKFSGPLVIGRGVMLAVFVITHTWAMTWQQIRDGMAALASRCADALPDVSSQFLRIHGNCGVWLVQMDKNASEDDFSYAASRICEELEAGGVMLRCVYLTGLYSWETVRERYHKIAELGARSDVPQRQTLPYQDAMANSRQPQQSALQNARFKLQALEIYLSLGQQNNFKALVTQTFNEQVKPQINIAGILQVYYGVLAILYQGLNEQGECELKDTIRSEYLSIRNNSGGWEQSILERLLSFVDKTFEIIFPQNPYAHPEVIAGIQRYIRDNIDKDLSLNALSKRFNMNPNYLSRLFHEHTGEKLHDYITKLRMGTAERLLLTSVIKVNEIASRVGYDSVHTFIRAFRRQFGDTPAEYRAKKGTNV